MRDSCHVIRKSFGWGCAHCGGSRAGDMGALEPGRNWSDKVVLKVDHELIRNGPYRYLRHPIYSGVLIAVAGTALKIGEWRGVVALVALGVNYFVKAKREEAILAANFREAFAAHKRHTGFFLPGL